MLWPKAAVPAIIAFELLDPSEARQMAAILGILIVYLVFQTILLAVGVGVGLALHWCVPGLTVDMGVLVGVLSALASAYFLAKMMRAKYIDTIGEQFLADLEDEDEDDSLPDMRLVLSPTSKNRRQRSKKKMT